MGHLGSPLGLFWGSLVAPWAPLGLHFEPLSTLWASAEGPLEGLGTPMCDFRKIINLIFFYVFTFNTNTCYHSKALYLESLLHTCVVLV